MWGSREKEVVWQDGKAENSKGQTCSFLNPSQKGGSVSWRMNLIPSEGSSPSDLTSAVVARLSKVQPSLNITTSLTETKCPAQESLRRKTPKT